ncbi:uncharacterized protein LOC107475294 isoform X1 [Arachis duranensis]|uniref:Uncharacterized protein LOC107475294 isoform X1 n=1 Tax=Arachis duranensis TaxID=130453 RepID=A0A6P4CG20_ARADU|nr:uncharacterized protein LOC107475294 isoform X1 [Arachis duranensis]
MPKGKESHRGARVFLKRSKPYTATDGGYHDYFRKAVDDCINSSSSTDAVAATHSDHSMMSLNTNNSDEKIDGIVDLKSMGLQAAEELSKRPKNGQIYASVKADFESINARLKNLSLSLGEPSSIDEGIEIADAASLLKLLDKSNREIDMAGEMAQKGVLLMVHAQIMLKKGQELLDQSKLKLRCL